MRLEDFADRLGDRMDAVRTSLEGNEDVAVVDAREPHGGLEALLIATRRGLLVAYPWASADECLAASTVPGWVAWGDVRASTVQTIPAKAPAAPGPGGTATVTVAAARHWCTVLVRGVGLIAQGDGDVGRRAVDAFHDEVVRRGTPWHYPS
jgi:hypothetical protein